MSEGNDADRVRGCLAGNRRAFEELVDRYEKTLFNVAYRITGNTEDAMDAMQAAFVKAYERLETFDPSFRFFSWIYRIAVNESLDLLDRRSRYRPMGDEPRADVSDPESDCRDSELGRHVQSALMELKPEHRVVIVLRHFRGLSYKEMAAVIGISEKTVKSRLFSARQRLREILIEQGVVR